MPPYESTVSANLLRDGAVFLGKFSKLPSKVAKIVGEMELYLKPPAMLRPMKPKLWLVRHTELKAGKFYRLM